jgi:hypothetical protein
VPGRHPWHPNIDAVLSLRLYVSKPVLVVAGVCLLTLVFLAISAATAGQAAPPLIPRLSANEVLLGWLVLGAAFLFVVARAVGAWLGRRRRRGSEEAEAKPVRVWPLFVVAAAALLLGYAATALVFSLLKMPKEDTSGGPPAVARTEEPKAESEPAREAEVEPIELDPNAVARALLAAAAAGLAALLVVYAVRRWRHASGAIAGSERREKLRQDLAQALRVSLEGILAEEDCRRAIIACYARMEQSFALAGLARRSPETPFEFLARAVRDARIGGAGSGRRPVGGALRELTRLYELARFSEHPLEERDRREAIGAIRAVEEILKPEGRQEAGIRMA